LGDYLGLWNELKTNNTLDIEEGDSNFDMQAFWVVGMSAVSITGHLTFP
jgi:hypothetical protein